MKKLISYIICMLFFIPVFAVTITSFGNANNISPDQGIPSYGITSPQAQPVHSVQVTITPFNPPIIIPDTGGEFQYSIVVKNNEGTSLNFYVWTIYEFPDGTTSDPVFGPANFKLPSKWSANRDDLSTDVAADMPSGMYTYYVYCGDYPKQIWDSDSFTFEKLPGEAGWYAQMPGIDERLLGVDFTDTENGWAVGTYHTILHTTNGGDTWFPQDDGQYYIQNYDDVDFIDDQIGWVFGSKILHTTDGGDMWIEQYDPSYGTNGGFFIDENNGWAVGGIIDTYNEIFVHYILHTANGGDTWSTQLYESGYYYDTVGPLNDIYFTDANHGWAVGYDGIIYGTTDGGANWNEQDSGVSGTYDNELYSVAFSDINHGWVTGESGILLYTTDGGTNWNTYDLGTDDYLNSVVFIDENNGWIAGYGYYPIHGSIFHTSDGGTTWEIQDTGTDDDEYFLYDLSFVDEYNGGAAGSTWYPFEGVMLHTETGGGASVYPELSYEPSALDYGEMYQSQEQNITIDVWNSGTGTLWYYLYVDAYAAQYLSFTPEEGFSAGEHDTITATLYTGGLQPGTYHWDVTLYSNDETVNVPVDVTIVESQQELSYAPLELDFGDVQWGQAPIMDLDIWNSGTGTMYYWIDDSGTFCIVEPWSGSSQGEVNTHTVMCFTSGLDYGHNECTLIIHSSGGNAEVPVYVNVVPQ